MWFRISRWTGAFRTIPKSTAVSFTGSTRVGATVAKAAADLFKRVSQELGGKSAVDLVLPDADCKNQSCGQFAV
ncbi:MAG: aldehyde dehydrogenase family protein [Sphingomonadales bacterium]|nr:aldehyde dehydrogenase family protein [Sphingomonadales bacterium]